jgi:NAD(P)H-hydrate repair Nnr-like enzyme with NAD(P)H-hydrate dehydratase domain
MLHFQETLREQDPKTYQAMVLGPGGLPEDGSFWEWFADWTREGYPLIIDAQGLREWTRIKEHFCGDYAQVLLTPHPGEFSGLTNLDSQIIQRQAIAICRDFSQREGVMVLFKSADPTLICPDGRTTVIPGQNPRMGTAGNGDFLSGILGALLMNASIQGNDLQEGAVLGTWVHQQAGRKLKRVFTPQELGPIVGKIVWEVIYAGG